MPESCSGGCLQKLFHVESIPTQGKVRPTEWSERAMTPMPAELLEGFDGYLQLGPERARRATSSSRENGRQTQKYRAVQS